MNPNTVEARLLATGDERREVGQGPADRNSERNACSGYLTTSFT
jgi:hypothetical protein